MPNFAQQKGLADLRVEGPDAFVGIERLHLAEVSARVILGSGETGVDLIVI